MAAKAKKSSSAKKNTIAAAKPNNSNGAVKKDPKALEREITNELFTDEERARMFFAQYWKYVVAVAVLAVLAVTSWFAVTRHFETVKNDNTARLADAKTAAEIEAAIKNAADAPGADAARFRLAKLYVEEKKYDKARQVLSALAGTTDDVTNRDRAQLNIAYTLELEGKTADAAEKFSELASNTAIAAAIRAEAGYASGRLYIDLKKPVEAKKALGMLRAMKIKPEEQPGTAAWQALAGNLEAALD